MFIRIRVQKSSSASSSGPVTSRPASRPVRLVHHAFSCIRSSRSQFAPFSVHVHLKRPTALTVLWCIIYVLRSFHQDRSRVEFSLQFSVQYSRHVHRAVRLIHQVRPEVEFSLQFRKSSGTFSSRPTASSRPGSSTGPSAGSSRSASASGASSTGSSTGSSHVSSGSESRKSSSASSSVKSSGTFSSRPTASSRPGSSGASSTGSSTGSSHVSSGSESRKSSSASSSVNPVVHSQVDQRLIRLCDLSCFIRIRSRSRVQPPVQ
ncbi:unnamed protein product [Pichia kudriavzevii]